MATRYVLTNKQAGDRDSALVTSVLEILYDEPLVILDVTQIRDWRVFLGGMEPEDSLVIAGGDGTLHHFVNNTAGLKLPEQILYFPVGTGNDFARDLGRSYGHEPFHIRAYLDHLPMVEVNGQKRLFLNGVGFGIDGYCAQEGDRLRGLGKKMNFAAIAVNGLLFHYKPAAATITVDGKTYSYKKVWLAPAMFGKYYGGGMLPTPNQDRTAKDRTLAVMVFHNAGKWKTLRILPSVFKGDHIRHKDVVQILEGKDITVEFERPAPLQIDGEIIPNVTKYRVCAPK